MLIPIGLWLVRRAFPAITPTRFINSAEHSPGFLDQFIADQVPKGFGAVGITALGDEPVELLQEIAAEGHANSTKVGHLCLSFTRYTPMPVQTASLNT